MFKQKKMALSKIDSAASSWGQGKGKVHPCTGTEALYSPYGP